MSILIVIENPEECPLSFGDVQTVPARAYLTEPEYGQRGAHKVFNLCRSYRYQSIGYYVSLLAEARGHRAFPSVLTIQDLKSQGLARLAEDELGEVMQKALSAAAEGSLDGRLTLDIFFGKAMDPRLAPLAAGLYRRFPAPFLRAAFAYDPRHGWHLASVNPLPTRDILPQDRLFAEITATAFFGSKKHVLPRSRSARFDLAILHNPAEPTPPSNRKALDKFVRAAEHLNLSAELITREDGGSILEYDALFIRETTSVDHHTYRMARKAAAEGLVVIDDPMSILRCTNKVYLAELLTRHKLPAPRTVIAHGRNLDQVLGELPFPVICKQPDSSFSQGVSKARDRDELAATLKRLLDRSELVIVQEFVPSEFDWRIGVLDRQPLYACKYYMADDHWQIIKRGDDGRVLEGRVDAVPVEFVPEHVLKAALKAANLIGDGLYGVDLKQKGDKVYVIEVNDNPSIDHGFEDSVLKDELYARIMRVFITRIQSMKRGFVV